MLREAKVVQEAIAADFNRVVHSMFGKTLGLFWETDCANFEAKLLKMLACKKLGLKALTPKIHILLYHAPKWCLKRGCGFGKCSEQSFETSHHDFTVNCFGSSGSKSLASNLTNTESNCCRLSWRLLRNTSLFQKPFRILMTSRVKRE